MSSRVSRLRLNLRIVISGPLSESGGMTALTRLPSGRRASTIGDDSSMRRPTCATILLMIRRRCHSSLNTTSVGESRPATLDPDVIGPVDHDLGHALVGEEPLERAVAEDVVGDLERDPLPVVARDPGLLGELVADVCEHPLAEVLRVHADVVELRPEVTDDSEVDPALHLREGVVCTRGRRLREVLRRS